MKSSYKRAKVSKARKIIIIIINIKIKGEKKKR